MLTLRLARLCAPLVGVLLASCAQAPVTPHATLLALEKCGLATVMEPVLCGDLSVPEDRANPGGRRIPLNIVVIPALGEKTLPPLYDLAGGPGLPASGGASFWVTAGAIHRAHRDIVLVDQRGTGASHALPCGVYTANPYRAVLDDQDAGDCRDKLSAGADLAQYTTAAAVEDLEAVRLALGHERIDLQGLSYGTRVAQEYLRAHPDRVRAMVLLGTLSPAEKLPLPFGRDAAEVLARLVQQCTADKACHKAVPNPAADIVALQKKLAPGALKVTLPGGAKGEILAGPFWEGVRAQLVSVRTQRQLPWLLHEAAAGRYTPLLTQLAPEPEHAALGAFLSVSCPEDSLLISDAEIAAASGGVFGNYRLQQQVHACRIWGLPPVTTPRTLVDSPVPTLLLAGEMDAMTPVQQARDVATHLRNARVVVVPDLGHFPDGLTNMACYDRIIAAFFDSADASTLDTSCLATMQPPAFQTRAESAR